jgi:molecular chaperone GrpE
VTEERDELVQEKEGGDDESPPAASTSADAEASAVEEDLGELMEKARERDEYLSLAQRTQADFENYRKRAAKEMSAAEARGVAKLAREILPALDNLALALVSAEEAGEEFVKGIRLVHSELVAALERLGIEPYDPSGERFDPEFHEAMAQQPVEGAEPGTVVEVYQQGYRINGTVLRPARVVVAE